MCIRDRVSNEPFSAQDIAIIEQQADQFGFDAVSYTHLDVYKRQL